MMQFEQTSQQNKFIANAIKSQWNEIFENQDSIIAVATVRE